VRAPLRLTRSPRPAPRPRRRALVAAAGRSGRRGDPPLYRRDDAAQTTWTTATGTATVTDALATGDAGDPHAIGAKAPRLLVRALECTGGEVAGAAASGRLRLAAGDRMLLGLQHRTTAEPWPGPLPAEELDDALRTTAHAWRAWSRLHQNYRGPWRDLVHHSGRVLQALSYQPTGAVIAAATTSLPEQVGGERNCDYRYAWVRDASFTLEALWVSACPDEAHQFFDYLAASSAGQVLGGRDLQIMFGVGGEHDLSERTLPHLAGWRESRPVRVGNGAWNQRQIDVYGELLGSAHQLVAQLNPDHAGATAWREFLVACADAAAHRWREKDQGIWEVRGERRHFLYSKLMCWVALDRATSLADTLRATDRVPAWRAAAEEIRAAILAEGWDDSAKSFTQSFGSPDLDASNLMIGVVGFLPPDDPRVVATVEAVADRLTDARGLVFRYRTESGRNADGLAGEEGTFLLCTFWLAQALAAAGQVARARTVFERAARYVNDVGLLAEEVDPATGDLLGNFPQAFSHIGLVNAAWAIAQAETTARPRPSF
jgi:alpha,alpha-trehalase